MDNNRKVLTDEELEQVAGGKDGNLMDFSNIEKTYQQNFNISGNSQVNCRSLQTKESCDENSHCIWKNIIFNSYLCDYK